MIMPADNTFPELQTERLMLTAIEKRHAPELFSLFTDKKVTEYYTVVPLTREEDILPVIDHFEWQHKERQGIRWALHIKEDNRFIGTIGFRYFTKGHKGAVVYALQADEWNKGYISEALDAVLKFGFEKLSLLRVEAEVMPGNDASGRVLAKAGFVYEGRLAKWLEWGGQHYDIDMYGKVKEQDESD